MIKESVKPTSVIEIQELIRQQPKLAARGGGSKSALHPASTDGLLVNMTGLAGLLDYQPEEFTFTARAGSRVDEIQRVLGERGQFLPFDPVLVERGATLGGTVASGLSGPGRYRYGGLRDFLLGIKFVDGMGNLVRSGGKVVKNAAGFDLSKFMVGSLGHYGVLVEVTLKVFPQPAEYLTLRVEYPAVSGALAALTKLTATPFELFALDLEVHEGGCALLVRLGGLPETLPARLDRLRSELLALPQVQGVNAEAFSRFEGSTEAELWRSAREFLWVKPGHTLVKVPLTSQRVPPLDEWLADHGALRRYSAGGNLAWIAWQGSIEPLHALLQEQGFSGLAILGSVDQPFLGKRVGDAFARRVKNALDPQGKFG